MDSTEYLALARALAEDGSFHAVQGRSGPESYRTPGYPLFLSVIQPWRSMARLRTALLVQLLLVGCCGVLLVDALTRLRLVGLRGALAASSLLVLNPMLLVLSLEFLTESLFVFCCCVGTWALARSSLRSEPGFALVSGLAFGAATLVRPIGLVLLCAVPASLILTAALSFLGSSPVSWKPPWRVIVVWILAAGLFPAGWTVRNGLRAGFWGVSKTGMSFVASAYGESYLVHGVRAGRQTAFDHGEGRLDTARGVALAVASHPRESLESLISGFARTALGPGEWTMRRAVLGHRGDRDEESPLFRVVPGPNGIRVERDPILAGGSEPRTPGVWMLLIWSLGVTGLSYFLTVLAVIRRAGAGRWLLVVALTSAAALFAASAAYTAYARFRVPILPFLAVSAGFGYPVLARVWARISNPAAWRPAFPDGVLAPPGPIGERKLTGNRRL